MNKIPINISLLHNKDAVEPIALKLAHNEKKTEKRHEEDVQFFPMWWVFVTWVFILVVFFMISYFIVNHNNYDNFYEDEDYGELQHLAY
ncbi:hypothetical protein [Diatraea saccharalis granulovirus]|uniref:Uncharacterized protein n=1 Tax=Diatraea saccharalis granulovirus TaxID=1675862 RepID=A0A0R7EYT6_9BBAC|nr:hypothetical protein [Diatraea saccharalis granulovirus]AKN80747.1 hypothetical protein [Diatraea saccharalis granulovirus]